MELPAIFIGSKISALTRKWLVSEQIRFVEQPFVRISYRKPDLKFFSNYENEDKKWVVTSSYAAHWLVRFAKSIGFKKDDEVYCLTEKQEDILAQYSANVIRPRAASAESLAELLVARNDERKIFYLKGNKSLNYLPEVLDANRVDWQSVEVYKNTSIELFMNEVFDGYLFFSESAIKNYKASGNFPNPKAPVLAKGTQTAQAAWAEFPNLVFESSEQEELSFVKYAIRRIIEKFNEPEIDHTLILEE